MTNATERPTQRAAQQPVRQPVRQPADPAPGAPCSERPILGDLIAVGVFVNSVWDLVATAAPYCRARGVLQAHLDRGGYDEDVMLGLSLALERISAARP